LPQFIKNLLDNNGNYRLFPPASYLKGQCLKIFECWFFASSWSSWSP